ncbi:MAG: glycosyl transferase family 1 [Halobacteriovorax sp.]|nr:glycosyl transferase family 1 [Halobacteriovorax sp.]
MKKIKILTIGHSYVVAANRTFIHELAKDPRYDITMVAPERMDAALRSIEYEEETTSQIKIIKQPVRLTKKIHFFMYRGLDEVIKPGAFDFIHLWEEPYIFSGYQIAKKAKMAGIPYFFVTYQNLNKRYPFPFSYFERYVVKHCKYWVTGAKLVYETLIKRDYPVNKNKMISLSINDNIFYPAKDAAEKESIKSELGLSGTLICFLGRIVADKGIDILLPALENIKEPFSLLILGAGPDQEKVEQWVSRHRLQDRVKIILAKHHEVPKYLRACDIVVAPSQTMPNWVEQFGRMLVEAFASEVAVIGSTSGEIPYVIGDAGLVVNEKDINAWTKAISKLLSDDEFRRDLAAKGRARYLEHFQMSQVSKKYSELYQSMLDYRWHLGQ